MYWFTAGVDKVHDTHAYIYTDRKLKDAAQLDRLRPRPMADAARKVEMSRPTPGADWRVTDLHIYSQMRSSEEAGDFANTCRTDTQGISRSSLGNTQGRSQTLHLP